MNGNINLSYHTLLETILETGKWYDDPKRSGTKRLQIPDYEITHDLTKSFPAITTKKLAFKGVVAELIWFLRGDTSIEYLIDNNCNIWNKDAYNYYVKHMQRGRHAAWLSYEEFVAEIKGENEDELGQLGPVYGHQWRNFFGVDQIANLIDGIKTSPMATDHLVMAWNPAQSKDMALEPCHFGFIIEMEPLDEVQLKSPHIKPGVNYGFTLKWFQRSVDTFLGLPFNIASYATLAHIIGRLTNTMPLRIKGSLSSVHLYDNSIDQVKKQLSRDIYRYNPGELSFGIRGESIYKTSGDLNDIFYRAQINDFQLPNYESYPGIAATMLSRDV
jgi:thymidylate synthase